MNRMEAIEQIIHSLEDGELVIHCNGTLSRESHFCRDRKRNFYLVGSMGLASSVGLGLALAQPGKRVIILDGDGNILMGFGNLALIGTLKPHNLVHFVLDNRVYGTTGNQPTISPGLDLAEIAASAGYRSSGSVDIPDQLRGQLAAIKAQPGPHFIQVKVSRDVSRVCPRIPYSARQLKERFMDSFSMD